LNYNELRRVTQIAIVVKDIERARAVWAELLGVEEQPIVEIESWESTHMMFRGKPSKGRAKLSFFNLENIVLELIQPIDGPSTWQNFLEKYGEGIHHIAFHVENLEETLEKFRRMGIKVEQKGEFKGGCYVYTNSKSELGAIIELLHMHS
jgi:catechol 2,3-dioxygenase-like lactoylglutathione lyase family enzyme